MNGQEGSILSLLETGTVADDEYIGLAAPVISTGGDRDPNSQQVEAILAPIESAAVRVLAGPGSGKTFVMTRRVAHLLEMRIRPDDIVAVTLTKAMATEMWERLVRLIPNVANSPLERTVCTIHALCYRIWRGWTGESRRIPRRYEIEQTLEDLGNIAGFNGDRGLKATPDVLESWVNVSKSAGYSTLKSQNWYRKVIPDSWIAEALFKVRRGFDEWMAKEGYITFEDMMLNVELLLRDDKTAAALCGRYIIVDEGQDATNQAMRILTKLAQGGQFFIVGDADQLLFRFAGATPERNLGTGWETLYPGGLTYKLETNYRSVPEIISSANDLIDGNYDDSNAHLKKALVARDGVVEGPGHKFTVLGTTSAEGEFVSQTIGELVRDGDDEWGDFFVGGRTRASLAGTERALTIGQVPYVNLSGRSFWALKHIKVMWSYLAVALNGNDRTAFREVYNIASRHMRQPFDLKKDGKVTKAKGTYINHRWLGRAFIQEYPTYNKVEGQAPKDFSFRYRSGANDLRWSIEGIKNDLESCVESGKWTEVMEKIVDEIVSPWYREDRYSSEGQGSAFEEDMDVVLEIAKEYPTPQSFIEFTKSMMKASTDEAKMAECVVIGTIHKLKGRERKKVFWVGAAEGICPTPFALGQVGARKNELPPPGGPSLMEDERCCAYVVLTRAKEQVFITAPLVYRNKIVPTSRFVKEFCGHEMIEGELGLPEVPGLTEGDPDKMEVENAEKV